MKKGEVTIITLLLTIAVTLLGAYTEKNYGITLTIEKAFTDSNTTKDETFSLSPSAEE